MFFSCPKEIDLSKLCVLPSWLLSIHCCKVGRRKSGSYYVPELLYFIIISWLLNTYKVIYWEKCEIFIWSHTSNGTDQSVWLNHVFRFICKDYKNSRLSPLNRLRMCDELKLSFLKWAISVLKNIRREINAFYRSPEQEYMNHFT